MKIKALNDKVTVFLKYSEENNCFFAPALEAKLVREVFSYAARAVPVSVPRVEMKSVFAAIGKGHRQGISGKLQVKNSIEACRVDKELGMI